MADAGLDADDVAKELTDTRTLSRAYNADYTQYLAVLIREDELSQEIYEIDAMTDAQKTTLRRRAESNSLWETTGLRAQDVEWQKENGENWLYIHYIVTRSARRSGVGCVTSPFTTGCMWSWTGGLKADAFRGGI